MQYAPCTSLHRHSSPLFGGLPFNCLRHEVVRRIVAKAVLFAVLDDIQIAAWPHQLCVGQIAGTKAAVHTVRSTFNRNDCDAMLLVDASNAFNSFNSLGALHNIQQKTPLACNCVLINIYRSPASLFVSGDTLFLEEGTTQGNPLAMLMCAVALVPLISHLLGNVSQVW